MQYFDRFVDMPVTLWHETALECPQVLEVEAVSMVPRPTVVEVPRCIPKVETEIHEKILEVPLVLRRERLVETPGI